MCLFGCGESVCPQFGELEVSTHGLYSSGHFDVFRSDELKHKKTVNFGLLDVCAVNLYTQKSGRPEAQ